MQPIHNSKKTASVDTWTEAFIVFASIYLARYPSELQDISKYMKTIRLGASRTPSGAWLENDRQFRLKMAKHTSMSFSSVDGELWLLYMSNQPTAQQTHPTLKCYDFNFKGSCTRYQCSYHHTRTCCHKNHLRIHCWSNPNTTSSSSRPNTLQTSQSNFRSQPFQQYAPRPRPHHPNQPGNDTWDLSTTPIKFGPIEKQLIQYPDQQTAQYLSNGFKYGFRLHYTGLRLPSQPRNICQLKLKKS
jgi:hypothetical protein